MNVVTVNVNEVDAVLLADGWHTVSWTGSTESRSTFNLGRWELTTGKSGEVIHVPGLGAEWLEPPSRSDGEDTPMYCPFSSILALREKELD